MEMNDFNTTLQTLSIINDQLEKIAPQAPDWGKLKKYAWDFCRQSTFLHVLCGESGVPAEITSAVDELRRYIQIADSFLNDETHISLLNEAKEKLADCEAVNFGAGMPSFSSDREEAFFKLLKSSLNCAARVTNLLSIESYLDINRSLGIVSTTRH